MSRTFCTPLHPHFAHLSTLISSTLLNLLLAYKLSVVFLGLFAMTTVVHLWDDRINSGFLMVTECKNIIPFIKWVHVDNIILVFIVKEKLQ